MFKNADRLPSDTSRTDTPAAVPPWGLRRMAPYKDTIYVEFVATQIDPETQMGAAADGELIQAKHKKSNTGTETPTATNRDGANPSQDADQSQDSDQD